MLRQWLGDLLHASFPSTRMAFAYGSGVFTQATVDKVHAAATTTTDTDTANDAAPMIDMVFAVDDPKKWHEENIQKNRHHYSLAAHGGAAFVTRLQRMGAHVWYNALVPVPKPWGDGRLLMKYGVISSRSLEKDLSSWSSFYISGRMQKPVAWIEGYEMSRSDNVAMLEAGRCNLKGAASAALLLLPEKFTEGQLYETITGLSYAGDFRMAIAENPDKVMNIVRSGDSPIRFRHLYEDVLSEMSSVVRLESGLNGGGSGCDGGGGNSNSSSSDDVLSARFEQDVTPEGRGKLLRGIPLECQRKMASQLGSRTTSGESRESSSSSVVENDVCVELLEQVERRCHGDAAKVSEMYGGAMRATLSSLVSQTALQQTMKGLASVGITKSVVYSINKMKKRLKY